MTTKHRLLIFPAGSEIGLEIHNSLKYSHHVELFGASGKNDHASYIYDEEHYFEDNFYVNQPDFIERFNHLLRHLRIEFIYPTHDTIANFLAMYQAELVATVITSCARTNQIARSKSLTYATFKNQDFCPRVYCEPRTNTDIDFPLFLKPDNGQGGKGSFIVEDARDLDFYMDKHPDLLATEYLPGEELSVDCFSNFNGELLFVGPRTRERVQMGISFRSTSVPVSDEIRRIADTINQMVSLDGAWFFQVKKDLHGKYKLLEFAPRQSSTMGLYRHSGVNFALLSMFNALKIPVKILQNDYTVQLDRRLQNRFKAGLKYTHVYIDLDETLIIGQHVHEMVMAFMFQCRNRGIRVTLLTKHRYNLHQTLYDCGIAEQIFTDIIHLTEDQDKADFINPESAIFIDNYWRDRQVVKERLGIPVFDVDAIECLLH